MAGTTRWIEQPGAETRYRAGLQQDSGVTTADGSRLGEMVGRSLVMQRLFVRLRQAAMHLRILALDGEPGTGKALLARTLHEMGPAADMAFVACSASRFTSSDVQPLLEDVRGGTLFLTRINELTSSQQARLFDFLEWWEHRNGHDSSGYLPRQIFVSSQQPLRQLSANGILRADLCYRLTAIRFGLPPLRERREDISMMAEWFAMRQSAMHGKPVRGLGPGTLSRLMSHTWPGNVRELESVITNAAMECEGQWIRPIDIPPLLEVSHSMARIEDAGARPEEDPNLDHMIHRHITQVLAKTGGNKLRAAQLLGISRSTLYRLLEPGSSVQ